MRWATYRLAILEADKSVMDNLNHPFIYSDIFTGYLLCTRHKVPTLWSLDSGQEMSGLYQSSRNGFGKKEIPEISKSWKQNKVAMGMKEKEELRMVTRHLVRLVVVSLKRGGLGR